MEQIILIIHALIAVVIVALVLLQQGKGAEAGASFGSGASQTVFGVQGGGNLLTRWTAILAALFFASSLSLAHFAKQKSDTMNGVFDDLPLLEQMDVQQNEEIPAMSEESAESAPVAAEEVPSE